MYRLLCLDIDGTLLNSQHKITKQVKTTIQKAAANGCLVVLVSARMPKGIQFLQDELEIKAPIICYSGALIVDEASAYTYQKTIPIENVTAVWQAAKKQHMHLSLYKDDIWYVESLDAWALQESAITHIEPQVVDYKALLSTWENETTGPNKLLCMADTEQINQIIPVIQTDDLTIYRSKPTYLEIGSPQASKTAAIKHIAQKLDIPTREIICIGDNYNDIDMLKFAGLGIAMGNAPDEVKKQAKKITTTNDEDGVAVAIQKYYFEE